MSSESELQYSATFTGLQILQLCLVSHTEESTPETPTQTDHPEKEEHTVSDRKRRHLEPPAPKPVAVVVVYKTLGQLLPERYDSDRRSLRYSL